LKISIDRELLQNKLYEIKKYVVEAALFSDDGKKAEVLVDELIFLIMNAPQAENNASYPKPKLRRG
jgi:hypothetical protein